ncbi:hypothetical protein LY76DRAFT_341479 [Colletotrichum caudatum]|nr:hypothetical protein LY76DRAFT_341479 [Colletotrichum caudatum]
MFDDLNVCSSFFGYEHTFLLGRPFFRYAAFNWHEHVILGGDSALKALCEARYAAVIDISKPYFWTWFFVLAGRILLFPFPRPKVPLSTIWEPYVQSESSWQLKGMLLREGCLENLFHMDSKVHALLKDSSSPLTPLP